MIFFLLGLTTGGLIACAVEIVYLWLAVNELRWPE